MTRGIVEMARLGEFARRPSETFSGLSGIGDLIVTCTSKHSRNRHVGRRTRQGPQARRNPKRWAWSWPKA
ncbi:MAG: hypothetical protein IPP19_05740 [Verrucomicrobia bacterium]|nr:hypothetical protein [Verrucomicrobiota bacterium]